MKLNFETYQKESKKTAIYQQHTDGRLGNLYYVTLGLMGEDGEIAEKIKKVIRDEGGEVNDEKKELLKKEIGDVLWYMAQLCTELDLEFEEVAQHNLEKLLSRQKRGKLQGSGDER